MRLILMVLILLTAAIGTLPTTAQEVPPDATAAAPVEEPAPAPAAVEVPEPAAPTPAPVEAPAAEAAPPLEEATAEPAEPTPTPPAAEDAPGWSSIGWKLVEYTTPVLGAFLAALVGFAIRWLNSKTSSLRWSTVIQMAGDAARTSVLAVQQTYVDAIVASGGKLTEAQALEASRKALAATRLALGTKGLDALKAVISGGEAEVTEWLTSRIEASVQSAKKVPT
jgi:hypothetical protein